MNKKKFKKLVEPYLRDSGNLVNQDLIKRNFEMRVAEVGLGTGFNARERGNIPLKNELIFIPAIMRDGKGTFVFSDDSQTYSWKYGIPRFPDEWGETTAHRFVDSSYSWFVQPFPITRIESGAGWSISRPYEYYVFKSNKNKLLNWSDSEPWNQKV